MTDMLNVIHNLIDIIGYGVKCYTGIRNEGVSIESRNRNIHILTVRLVTKVFPKILTELN